MVTILIFLIYLGISCKTKLVMDNKALTFLLLAIFGAHEATSANINITSPPVTNWGVWGQFERCPSGQRVQAFQLKTEQFKGPFEDDTALNGIRLFCGDPSNPNTVTITSAIGPFGGWGGVFSCFPSDITGFQLRVEPPQGFLDDTATNNVRMICSGDPNGYVAGDGLAFGSWGESRHCQSNQGVCGFRTQVDACTTADDCTSLNNVMMECCD